MARTIPRGLLPQGFQRLALNTTGQALNSTVKLAKVLDISVETQNARYRSDATAPTATTGVLLVSGQRYRLEGYNGTSNLKFVAATAGSVINVQGWKY